MIELTQKQLERLQALELEMLVEIDRICRKYKIKYAIAGGTLLGAVRHKGFIPWDDDADVGMLRTEYERFREICKVELDHERFYFQDDRNTKGYRWGYGKLRRKNTLFLREYQENMPYEQGVFVDIFPIDGVSDVEWIARANQFHCFCIRKLLWAPVGKIAENNPVKKRIYQLMSYIPDKFILTEYHRMIARSIQYNEQSKFVRVLMYPMPNGIHDALRECFTDTCEMEFEGVKLQGPANYEYYLRLHYGDYMVLPPKESRKVHPVSDIELI